MLELPANGLLAIRPRCSEKRHRQPYRRPMNANSATKPGMMPIKNLAKNGPVGILKRRCTTAGVRIRVLTAPRPIKLTSTRCHSAWQPNPAEAPLIDTENLFRQPGASYRASKQQQACTGLGGETGQALLMRPPQLSCSVARLTVTKLDERPNYPLRQA